MSDSRLPGLTGLSRDESIALLERNHIGRLAFTFRDRVDIEPISYVYADGWLYARTSPGTKLNTVEHNPWVAFEVDEIKDRFDWRSVVVRGTIYFLEDGPAGREAYENALAILRTAEAEALTPSDTAPFRQTLFRIHTDDISGRQARV